MRENKHFRPEVEDTLIHSYRLIPMDSQIMVITNYADIFHDDVKI